MQRLQVDELREAEAPAGEIEPGEPDVRRERHGREETRLFVLEQRCIRQRSRRNNPNDLARYGAFARCGIADLLADRHGLAEPHEPAQVRLHGMRRHAGHGNRFAARLAAPRECDIDELRRAARIVVEQLIEIAHPIEQQRVRKPRLDGVVLLHDRRVLTQEADTQEGDGFIYRGRIYFRGTDLFSASSTRIFNWLTLEGQKNLLLSGKQREVVDAADGTSGTAERGQLTGSDAFCERVAALLRRRIGNRGRGRPAINKSVPL